MMPSCTYSAKVLTNSKARRIEMRNASMLDSRPLQEATFEDPHQRHLAAKLEVVLLLSGALVALQTVVRQVERFDLTDNVLVKAFVGRFQIVLDGVELAAGPGDLLATNGGFRIGTTDELACPPDHDFFEQVEDTNTACFDGLPASGQKVGV